MGTPTRDALVKLATNKGRTQDPSAPQELSDAKKQEVEKDKELNKLIARRDELRAQLIAIYHQIQKGKLTDLYREFIKAANRVKAHKKKLLRYAEETQRKEFLGLSEMPLSSKTTKARRFNSIQIPLTFCPSGKCLRILSSRIGMWTK